MGVPTWFKVATSVVAVVLLLVDLALVLRRPRVPTTREATAWVVFYVTLAAGFGLLLLSVSTGKQAGAFFAGWLTEYSLSADNLFVFLLIMRRFAVPRDLQQQVLMIGILLSLVLRGGFIVLGAEIIDRFGWVFYLFGFFLVYTAVGLLRESHDPDESEYEENAFIRWSRRVLPLAADYDGRRLRTVEAGRAVLTPMVIVLLAIGTTDVLFALDSIPAIFGLTKDPFIVFAATVFALMGLRQLYFLLGGLLDRLVYLSYGLATILAFIGVKLVLEALHTNAVPFVNGGHPVHVPLVPIWLSLAVIAGSLVVTAVASLAAGGRSSRPVD